MVVPAGAKVEDVVEAAPEKVPEEIVPAVEVKPASKKEKKRNKIDIQEVEAVPEPKEVVDPPAAPASDGSRLLLLRPLLLSRKTSPGVSNDNAWTKLGLSWLADTVCEGDSSSPPTSDDPPSGTSGGGHLAEANGPLDGPHQLPESVRYESPNSSASCGNDAKACPTDAKEMIKNSAGRRTRNQALIMVYRRLRSV